MSATFITCGNKVSTAHCTSALHDEGKKMGLPYEIFKLDNLDIAPIIGFPS